MINTVELACFLALATADKHYKEKLQSNERGSKLLFEAGWKVEELKNLVDTCQILIATVSSIKETVADSGIDFVEVNMARTLRKLRESLHAFIRDLSRHQRHVATHIFVLMISCEQRCLKPYAIPVQCLPYHSINQRQLRQLLCTLIKEMVSRGMKVAGTYPVTISNLSIFFLNLGFCSDGEFNSMRSQGYTRPLSIFKIRSSIRSKYAKSSKKKMIDMLTPTCYCKFV